MSATHQYHLVYGRACVIDFPIIFAIYDFIND